MVENYMPDILKGHISTVTRAMHISTAAVKHYIHMIGHLLPTAEQFRDITDLTGEKPLVIQALNQTPEQLPLFTAVRLPVKLPFYSCLR